MEPNELAAVAGRYRDMIYRVALHWCGHPQEAEDATQDTLLKLCATHRTFADEEHLKSWLIRVTINHCKSRLRAPWHTRRLPLEHLDEASLDRQVGRHVDTVESLRASIAQLKEQAATPQAAAEAGWNDGMLKI